MQPVKTRSDKTDRQATSEIDDAPDARCLGEAGEDQEQPGADGDRADNLKRREHPPLVRVGDVILIDWLRQSSKEFADSSALCVADSLKRSHNENRRCRDGEVGQNRDRFEVVA